MFFCLITLAKDSSNALNKSSECGWPLSNLMQEEMTLAPPTPKPTVGFMYWHCHFDVCSFYIWSFESCLSHTAWVLSKPPLHLLEGPCCFSPSLRWPVLSHVFTHTHPTVLASGRWLMLGHGLWTLMGSWIWFATVLLENVSSLFIQAMTLVYYWLDLCLFVSGKNCLQRKGLQSSIHFSL